MMLVSSSCFQGGAMIKGWLADYSGWVMRLHCPVFDGVFVPLQVVMPASAAYWVADVLVEAVRYLSLEPVAFWVAEDVIRSRWSDE